MKIRSMTTKDGDEVLLRECSPSVEAEFGKSAWVPTHEMSEDGGRTWKPCRVTEAK